jgi:hypothetical protein
MNINWQALTHYLFSTLLSILAGAVMAIPSAMVLKVRVFNSAGIDQSVAEFIMLCIVGAGPLTATLTGLYRTFGTSDKAHAEAFKSSFAAEGAAGVFEIFAWACSFGTSGWNLLGQAVFLSISVGMLFYAIGNAVMSSSWYAGSNRQNNQRGHGNSPNA